MISNTLMIFGPGGIGKSPLDRLVRADAIRVDPYRLRPNGPRDRKDVFYAHPKLRTELWLAFGTLGEHCQQLSFSPAIEWFPSAQVTFFDVRGEWQCLLLANLSAAHAKAEIYAPAVPVLFQRPDIRSIFGTLSIVILNPVESLRSLSDFTSLKEATFNNCIRRGDENESAQKRAIFIDHEAAAWLAMLELGGTEYTNWKFPEYSYCDNPTKTLLEARQELLTGNSRLEQFFKTEAELQEMKWKL